MQVFVLGTLECPIFSAAFRKHPRKDHTFTSPSTERGSEQGPDKKGWKELKMKYEAEG